MTRTRRTSACSCPSSDRPLNRARSVIERIVVETIKRPKGGNAPSFGLQVLTLLTAESRPCSPFYSPDQNDDEQEDHPPGRDPAQVQGIAVRWRDAEEPRSTSAQTAANAFSDLVADFKNLFHIVFYQSQAPPPPIQGRKAWPARQQPSLCARNAKSSTSL